MNIQLKTPLVDIAFCIAIVLTILGLAFYFSDLIQSNDSNPFRLYNENKGIIQISFLKLVIGLIALISLIAQPFLKSYEKIVKMVLIISGLTIGILTWLELWYGSTFYYGEVRDKQGIGFPYLTLVFFAYPIWKIRFTWHGLNNWKTKVVATVLLIALIYLFFKWVEEPWKLW